MSWRGLARSWKRAVSLETLTSLERAGADVLLTYHATDVARWLARA